MVYDHGSHNHYSSFLSFLNQSKIILLQYSTGSVLFKTNNGPLRTILVVFVTTDPAYNGFVIQFQ
jgi:hypothetical protein